ncbi:MAG TPA: hypothetical protein VGF94_13385 [Kofleriaceae bacterium]
MTVAARVIATHPGSVDIRVDAEAWPLLGLRVGDHAIIETGEGDLVRGTVVADGVINGFVPPDAASIRVRRPQP